MLTPDCNENYGLKLVFCLFCRSEDKLEPRFNFEGHQLGVVSVDINLTGTRILLAQKPSGFYYLYTYQGLEF